jgi:hypothetical protein
VNSLANDLVENMAKDWLAGNIQEYFGERKGMRTQPASNAGYRDDCTHRMIINKEKGVSLSLVRVKVLKNRYRSKEGDAGGVLAHFREDATPRSSLRRPFSLPFPLR